jgi:hypothetical protein
MSTYGVKYQCKFDPILPAGATGYTLQLLQKSYSGAITNVVGSSVPVSLNWETDDPKAPIKGSSLAINLINDGSLPLTTFLSTDDDEWQVQFFYGANLIWAGYLVQDDCTETMLGYTHEINLSANDNLGLLKNVALNQSIVTYDTILQVTDNFSTTAPNTLVVSVTVGASVQNNDLITITAGIYSLSLTVIDNSAQPTLIVAEIVPNISTTSGNILLQRPSQFPDMITLATLFKYCLAATDLQLNTNIWGSLIEISQNTSSSFIDQTYINSQTFLKSGSDFYTYQDCNTILTNALASFKMCLFQSKGAWNIMRWDELRYFSNAITGYTYDSSFALLGTITNDATFIAGIGEKIFAASGLNHKIFRPFSFDLETFNYTQPAQLLRNFNLQTVGNLIRTYTTGSGLNLQTINEYACPWWYTDVFLSRIPGEPYEYYIRVTLDYYDNELDRYLVLANANATGVNTTWLDSWKIEANAGDSFNFTMSQQTSDNFAATARINAFILLNDGSTYHYLTPAGWVLGEAPYKNDFASSPTDQWNSYSTDALKYLVPADGLLYIILVPEEDVIGNISAHETRIKDMRLDYYFFISGTTKIIGQTHTNYQGGNIKLNESVEIFLDDSPRNSIAGTLFLSTSGIIQDRAKAWCLSYLGGSHNLGQIVTFEQLFWRRIPRSILEGTWYGLLNADGVHVSMLSVFKYTFFDNLNLVFGKLQIDFKNNNFTGTLWEIWADGETDGDLTANYVFNYLYSVQ